MRSAKFIVSGNFFLGGGEGDGESTLEGYRESLTKAVLASSLLLGLIM